MVCKNHGQSSINIVSRALDVEPIPNRRLVLTPDVRLTIIEILHQNAQEDLAALTCSQSDYNHALDQTRDRCRWLQGYGMSELAALKQGCAALMRISTDEIFQHEGIRDIMEASRLGDAVKARLIGRAVRV